MVISAGNRVMATEAGIAELGSDYQPLPTGDELREYWLNRLTGGERAIYEAVIQAYPEALDREEIGERTGYTRSSRNTYIQRLGARELIQVVGTGVRASDVLFE